MPSPPAPSLSSRGCWVAMPVAVPAATPVLVGLGATATVTGVAVQALDVQRDQARALHAVTLEQNAATAFRTLTAQARYDATLIAWVPGLGADPAFTAAYQDDLAAVDALLTDYAAGLEQDERAALQPLEHSWQAWKSA